MQSYRHQSRTLLPIILLVLISLACSSLPQLGASKEAAARPTRTPLPTFTPTLSVQEPLSILPTATSTPPLAPPTATPSPAPAVPPADTPVPEPTATDTPPPTEPPPSPPTEPPPPPAEPAAPAAQNGVEGKISFREGRNTYAVGEKVFVIIEAKNIDSGLKPFAILGLTPSTGGFQTSWTNGSIAAGETFRWEDGLAFNTPGAHKLWLSICFSTEAECQGANGNWVRFEPGLDVIIQ
ncbi:MAG: hypothetical protein AB1801_11635 [Chloroflexota bacterium]